MFRHAYECLCKGVCVCVCVCVCVVCVCVEPLHAISFTEHMRSSSSHSCMCSAAAVDQLSQLVQQYLSALEDCVVLANKMNNMLPEKERLETFHVLTTS